MPFEVLRAVGIGGESPQQAELVLKLAGRRRPI